MQEMQPFLWASIRTMFSFVYTKPREIWGGGGGLLQYGTPNIDPPKE